MKDIVISGKSLKRELKMLAICIGVAFLLNIYSIIKFKTDWIEILSQLHVVIAFGIMIYILVFIIRLIFTPIFRRLQKR